MPSINQLPQSQHETDPTSVFFDGNDADPLIQVVADRIARLGPADLALFSHELLNLRKGTADQGLVEKATAPVGVATGSVSRSDAYTVAMPSGLRAAKRVMSYPQDVASQPAVPSARPLPDVPTGRPANANRRKHPVCTRVIATTTVVGALAAGLVATGRHGNDPLPETAAYSCTDNTHRLVSVGTTVDGPWNLLPKGTAKNIQQVLSELGLIDAHETWSSVADALSDKLGYHISGSRLAAANPTAYALGSDLPLEQTHYDANGSISDSIGPDGTFCYNIPGPIIAGQVETDGATSLAAYARQYGMTVEALRKLNAPILVDDNAPIDPGFVLWTTEKPNTNLVLRKMTEKTPRDAAGGDPKLMDAITQANSATVNSGQPLTQGAVLYLPPAHDSVHLGEIIKEDQADYQPGHENSPARPAKKPVPVASPSPKPSPSVSPSGTESHPDSADPPALTAHQQEIINNLPGLTKEQRINLAQFVTTIMQLERAGKMAGINPEVTLAQAIDESSWGRDNLATQYHNYFGMKAGSDWHGPVAGGVGTHEYTSGAPSPYATQASFRAYPDMLSGFEGYIDKINQSSWYADARQHANDPSAYLDGMLNPPAWATDPNYKATILGIIKSEQLADLLAVVPGQVPETTPTPGSIKLNPNKYPANQRYLPGNNSKGAIVDMPDGSQVLSSKLTYNQRVQAIQIWLNRVQISAEGYQAFAGSIEDNTAQVKAKYPSFNGSKDGLGTPKPSDLKYFVLHFTASDTSGAGIDGVHFANSMAGRKLGVQFYINDKGSTYHLTDDLASHVLSYNQVAEGVEIAGAEQTALNAAEYTSAVYLVAYWLTSMGYVTQGTPSSGAVVDAMVRGHRELNPDGHEDNPQLVMDPIRGLIKQLLVQLGYKP